MFSLIILETWGESGNNKRRRELFVTNSKIYKMHRQQKMAQLTDTGNCTCETRSSIHHFTSSVFTISHYHNSSFIHHLILFFSKTLPPRSDCRRRRYYFLDEEEFTWISPKWRNRQFRRARLKIMIMSWRRILRRKRTQLQIPSSSVVCFSHLLPIRILITLQFADSFFIAKPNPVYFAARCTYFTRFH